MVSVFLAIEFYCKKIHQVYGNANAADLAATQWDQLQLNKVMQDIKQDNISSIKNALW